MTNFEVIEDAAMEQVKGGLSFSLGFDVSKSGISLDSPIGSVSIPNPISIAGDLFKTLTGSVGELISKVGNKLSDLGQLFDFS
jgi:hypothetical protein